MPSAADILSDTYESATQILGGRSKVEADRERKQRELDARHRTQKERARTFQREGGSDSNWPKPKKDQPAPDAPTGTKYQEIIGVRG